MAGLIAGARGTPVAMTLRRHPAATPSGGQPVLIAGGGQAAAITPGGGQPVVIAGGGQPVSGQPVVFSVRLLRE